MITTTVEPKSVAVGAHLLHLIVPLEITTFHLLQTSNKYCERNSLPVIVESHREETVEKNQQADNGRRQQPRCVETYTITRNARKTALDSGRTDRMDLISTYDFDLQSTASYVMTYSRAKVLGQR